MHERDARITKWSPEPAKPSEHYIFNIVPPGVARETADAWMAGARRAGDHRVMFVSQSLITSAIINDAASGGMLLRAVAIPYEAK